MKPDSLKNRFNAWWNGYELEVADEAPPRVAWSDDDEENSEPTDPTDRAPQRVGALQMIFGTGEDGPAATARCRKLIDPLGLSSEHSVVEVGCQLGTGLRVVAGETGAWIDGIEPVECFFAASQEVISVDGLQERAVPINSTLSDKKIQKHRRDAVISRESLHRFKNRKAVLEAVYALLRPQGQMVFTDYVTNPIMDKTYLNDWIDLLEIAPNLSPFDALRSELIDVGFDVHVAHDESKEYCDTIVGEMQRFAAGLKNNPIPRNMGRSVMTEIEYWSQVLTAIEYGALQLVRFHAIKTFDDPFAQRGSRTTRVRS